MLPAGLPLRWIAPRQRHARLQPLELDPGTCAGAQQPIGGLAQRGPALLSVIRQRGVEGREEGGDVGLDASAQLAIDKSAIPLLASAVPVVPHGRR